jgi:hypothetical protein
MSHCPILALRGIPVGCAPAGAVPGRDWFNYHGFDFTPDPSSGNRLPKFQTARSASAAESDLSLKASAERNSHVDSKIQPVNKGRIPPSAKADGPPRRFYGGFGLHRPQERASSIQSCPKPMSHSPCDARTDRSMMKGSRPPRRPRPVNNRRSFQGLRTPGERLPFAPRPKT